MLKSNNKSSSYTSRLHQNRQEDADRSTRPPTHHLHNDTNRVLKREVKQDDADLVENGGGPFVPSWELIPDAAQYMGNLTCPFEVAQWDLDSHEHPLDLENRRTCGKLRYRPFPGYIAPEPAAVFEKLPPGATIYFIGDSVTIQHSIDFACRLASIARVVRAYVPRQPKGAWCNRENICGSKMDTNGFTGIVNMNITFELPDVLHNGTGNTGITVVATKEDIGRVHLTRLLNMGKQNDVFVLNQGLHYLRPRSQNKTQEYLLWQWNQTVPALQSAMERGSRLVWRETSAVHFNTKDGYWSQKVARPQRKHSAQCVPSSALNATASRERSNGIIIPFITSLGIPILQTWEASFLLPAMCHVGEGVDCLHFLMSGGPTSFFTETLVKFIVDTF